MSWAACGSATLEAIGVLNQVTSRIRQRRPTRSRSPRGPAVGALGVDLIAALVVTSLIRRRLPHRLWRAVHWSAYAAWPAAVVHGIGMGSDAATWWLRGVTILCISFVGGLVVWRFSRPEDEVAAA